jgi:uncharacterized protein
MTLEAMLPILKVLLSFAAMLAGIRLRLGLFGSILGGSLLLALLFGMGPIAWLGAAVDGVTHPQTLLLAAIIAVILAFSDLLDKSGQAERLLTTIGGRIKRPRLALAFFPALIGLLPMPGGAVFSAPMVRSMADRLARQGSLGVVNPTDQALINYWYRHIWELAWPLYPGIIMAASLSGVPLATLAALLSPAPVLGILLGWWFFLRPKALRMLEPADQQQRSESGGQPLLQEASTGQILKEALPLLVAIVGAIVLELCTAWLMPWLHFEWGVLLALLAAFATCALQNRWTMGKLALLFTKRHLIVMLGVVAAIFVFKEALQQSGAIDEIAGRAGGGVALFAAAVFLPYFVGMVAGLNIAFVGAAFPLLLGLLEQMGLERMIPAYIVLGMFSGFAGVMSSPLHLCFILTCQYFQVDLAQAWRRVLLPCGVLIAAGVAHFLLIRHFLA